MENEPGLTGYIFPQGAILACRLLSEFFKETQTLVEVVCGFSSLQVALPANLTSITSGSYLPKVVDKNRWFFCLLPRYFSISESNSNYIR
jgi:hypothetical protein